jgi:2-C-methyl-D-erythritol 4-phosphate cytidylyltransferase
VWAIVVAAGSGQRFGAQKQFMSLGSSSLVEESVAAARSVADKVVVVLPPDLIDDPPSELARSFGADIATGGGATRSASVRSGLDAVPDDVDLILIHDAARPAATAATFEAVVEAVRNGADAAVPVLLVADTIYKVSADGRAIAAVDRSDLVRVQTPQAFRANVLRKAHADEPDATDDAGLLAAMGADVRVVAGDELNMKVTSPQDLVLLSALTERSEKDR